MEIKKLLFFVLYLILLNGFIQTYLIKSEYISLLSDVILFYIAFSTKNNILDISIAVGPWVVRLFAILLVGSTAISIMNAMPAISIIWGLRMVVRYLLLFMLVYKYFTITDIDKFKRILIRFFWINTLVVAYQFFIEKKVGDFIGGIFLNNGELFVFNLYCTLLLSKEYFIGYLSKSRFIFLLVVEMFVAMVAEIKVMYFTIPLGIYAVYIFTKKFSIKHIVVLVCAFFLLVPCMKMAMSLMYGEEYVNKTFDMEFIQEETSHAYNLSEEAADFSFNRTTCVEMASTLILKDPIHLLFGYGVGSGNTSEKFGTWISASYSKITSYNWFTSSWLLIEYGWVGYIIWILIFLLLAYRLLLIYHKSQDPIVKYWSSLGFISVMFTFIIAWYNNVPYYNAYFIYLFWAVCFVGIRERLKELENN